jgi:excisionase family DNA binding protein
VWSLYGSRRFRPDQAWLSKEVDALGLMQTQRKPMAAVAANELGPMLTASEVAEMLHLHVNTVKRLGDRGELPFYRVCKRGDRRFRLEDVMAFLDKNR